MLVFWVMMSVMVLLYRLVWLILLEVFCCMCSGMVIEVFGIVFLNRLVVVKLMVVVFSL